MKIVFVISHLKTGGAEKVLTLLANSFQSMGHSVSIIKFTKEREFFPLNENIKVINLKNSKNKFGVISKIISMKSEFEKLSFDVVIAFTTVTSIYSIIASKLAKIPIIVSEHTNFHRAKSNFWRYMRRVFYPFANKTVLLTNYDKDKYTFLKNKIVINNPLILQDNHSDIKREKIILAVGRLRRVKGFDLLIEAFSKIEDKSWKLEILGEGVERKNLEAQIAKLKLTNSVSLLGIKKDVEPYYKKASIFVLSSRAEGFPGTLCEAIGYGCSSIAFDCITGPKEIIIDNKNGILVSAKNIEELTKSIDRLIKDKNLRDSFSKESKAIKERLNIDKISSIWMNEIKEVL